MPTDGTAASVTTMQQSPPKAASSCIWIGRLQAGPDRNPPFRGQRRPTLRAGAAHRRAHAALADTMPSAVCAVDAAFAELADTALWCALTFELSGRRQENARPGLAKMYRVPPDRAWWPAVGAPLERGVRPQFHGAFFIRRATRPVIAPMSPVNADSHTTQWERDSPRAFNSLLTSSRKALTPRVVRYHFPV